MCVVLTGRKLCGIKKKVARNFPHLKAWHTSSDGKLLFRYSWKSVQFKKKKTTKYQLWQLHFYPQDQSPF